MPRKLLSILLLTIIASQVINIFDVLFSAIEMQKKRAYSLFMKSNILINKKNHLKNQVDISINKIIPNLQISKNVELKVLRLLEQKKYEIRWV